MMGVIEERVRALSVGDLRRIEPVHGHVHQADLAVRIRLLLSEERQQLVRVPARLRNEVAGRNEHAARSASRVKHNALLRLQEAHDQPHNRLRREEHAIIARHLRRKTTEEVFVDAPERVIAQLGNLLVREVPQQPAQQIRRQLIVGLGKDTPQHRHRILNRLHRIIDRLADVGILREPRQIIIPRILRYEHGGLLDEVIRPHRPRHSIPARPVLRLLQLLLDQPEPKRRMPQKYDAQHRHVVHLRCERRLIPQRVRRLPQALLQLIQRCLLFSCHVRPMIVGHCIRILYTI